MREVEVSHPRLSLLAADDRQRVHELSLQILAEVGVRVDQPSARGILRRAGAVVAEGGRCLLPAGLVAESLAAAPVSFPLFDRHGRSAFTCGQGLPRFGIGVTNLYYEDPRTGQISPFSRSHMADATRLGHSLGQYDMVSTPGVIQDEPVERVDLVATLEMVANTTKPLVLLVSDPDQFTPCLEMLEALHPGLSEKPFVMPYVNPITPLVLNAETTDKLTTAIERGLPVIFSNYGMAGASTSITPFRTLVLLNAELLAGLVFGQSVRRGAQVVLGSLPAYFDMRTMVDFYDPRSMLINLACAEMMAHYGIPHVGTSGSGNGWGLDIIAGGELWFNHLVSCAGQAGLVPFVGGNFGSKVFSPVTAMYGAEVIEQARAFAAGLNVGEAEGLLEEIRQAGPGGSFLESEWTLHHFRSAYHQSRIFPHYGLEGWQAAGRPSAEASLRAATTSLLAAAAAPGDHDEVLRRGTAWLDSQMR